MQSFSWIQVLNFWPDSDEIVTINRRIELKRNGEEWTRFNYNWYKVFNYKGKPTIDKNKPIKDYR